MTQNVWFQKSLISVPHVVAFFVWSKHSLRPEIRGGQDTVQHNGYAFALFWWDFKAHTHKVCWAFTYLQARIQQPSGSMKKKKNTYIDLASLLVPWKWLDSHLEKYLSFPSFLVPPSPEEPAGADPSVCVPGGTRGSPRCLGALIHGINNSKALPKRMENVAWPGGWVMMVVCGRTTRLRLCQQIKPPEHSQITKILSFCFLNLCFKVDLVFSSLW